ncbi:FbpB family small basic protein [Virgibacillus kekensis]|uniref:FbpB family small basic protein n=1 Tax=Virgibacillus kekensis TaxID=202261 RepID=A0ABV9DH92_9BACI
MSLKKRTSFDELVKENKRQILEDQSLLKEIELNLEMKHHQLTRKKAE